MVDQDYSDQGSVTEPLEFVATDYQLPTNMHSFSMYG